jgi:hypothetical protein
MSDGGEEDLTTTMALEHQCHDRVWTARADRGDRVEISTEISFQGQNSDIRALMAQWDLMARGGEGGEDLGLHPEADHMDLREVDTGLRREGTDRVEDTEAALHPLVGTAEEEEAMVLLHLE